MLTKQALFKSDFDEFKSEYQASKVWGYLFIKKFNSTREMLANSEIADSPEVF
jgi:hypothetical protein